MLLGILERLQKIKRKKWILLYFIFCLNFIGILLIVLMIQTYWGDINFLVSEYLGFDINVILISFIIILLPLSYIAMLLYKNLKCIKNQGATKPHIINIIVPLLLVILFDAVVYLIIDLAGGYSELIFQILEFYSIYINLVIVICLIVLIVPIVNTLKKLEKYLSNKYIKPKTKVKILRDCIILFYFNFFFIPFLFDNANIIYYDIPAKPDVVAHRGGSRMGPENTIETAQYSMNFGILGWEVDIAMSYDGVPFIMHDDTLTRTTNVEEIFPNRKNDRADNFTIAELKQLDAGSWFVEKDPFGTIASGVITQEQAEQYRGIKISTFEEVLNFTRDNNLILDFDTREPPEGHPYHNNYKEILLNMTLNSTIDLNNIFIPTSSPSWLSLIKSRNAEAIWTYEDYDNTGDGYTNAEYREFYREGFPIMVYTINSLERFCQLWCLGVRWVKTDAPYLFIDLNNPIWALRFEHYLILWGILYLVGVGSSVIIIYKNNKKKIKRN